MADPKAMEKLSKTLNGKKEDEASLSTCGLLYLSATVFASLD